MLNESLSIVLPVYNEEPNIAEVVGSVILYGRKHCLDFEVIVVNDGSKDATLEKLQVLSSSNAELRVLSHKSNQGYGAAIKTGLERAQKDWIFIMDSDGQFNIDYFDDFWKNRHGFDFILGYRVFRRDNLYRKFLGSLGNCLASFILKTALKDVNCGFKLFKTKELKGLSLVSTGGCIYFEILIYLLKPEEKKILQLPVGHYPRIAGRPSGGTAPVILDIIKQGLKILSSRLAD